MSTSIGIAPGHQRNLCGEARITYPQTVRRQSRRQSSRILTNASLDQGASYAIMQQAVAFGRWKDVVSCPHIFLKKRSKVVAS